MKNLTPHDIVLNANGERIIFEKSGELARVSVSDVVIGSEFGVDIVVSEFGEVIGVPEVGGERFIVSAMVLSALPASYRNQAFAPDTGSTAIRNEAGHVIAVTRLKTV